MAEAKRRQVPVLLSVGYSACHWCHVMAHESFEDPDTAAEMNRLFVNVKVDREERPDVDSIYMEAVQAMTGHGGWPMTVWLTPNGEPFYAGTYYPKIDRGGMPSFRRVMAAVADAWANRRDDLIDQAGKVTAAISATLPASPELPAKQVLVGAYQNLQAGYDRVNGGFGNAPKFPQQPVLEFLLRVSGEEWAPEAAGMLRQTLLQMGRGGIYDHLGGGFARYSVDAHWLVPHFEKMLYDNAQLSRLYLWAWQQWGDPTFQVVAEETLDYMLRDLAHPQGGFYSAEDADSEGVEGRFYVWTADEFDQVLGPLADIAKFRFGVTPEGNFEEANILHQARSIAEAAEQFGISTQETTIQLDQARRLLFERRRHRVRPGLDDKVITAWNGLAIRALAEAGAVLRNSRYLDGARAAARFILDQLRPGGRLRRSFAAGRPSHVEGFLDDYAAMAVGLFSLYRASGESEWYRQAGELTGEMMRLFSDPSGGFYSTAEAADALIKRPKDQFDNPLPSGNSLAAEALLLLSLYTGQHEFRQAAEAAVQSAGAMIDRFPSAVGHLLSVLWAMLANTKEVAVIGPEAATMSKVVWESYRPQVALAWSVDDSSAQVVPLLRDRYRPGRTLAYVCESFVCAAPVETAEALREELESTATASHT
jgi:uncharacterized protein YyaL (SSP411 family)